MSRSQREKVREEQLTGFKYFDRLGPLFARLHKVGCGPDKAHNRTLHFDQYCALVLLYLFNPVVVSLRSLQQASELKKVQRKLGCAGLAGVAFGIESCVRSEAARGDHRRTGGTVAADRGQHAAGGAAAHRDVGRWHAAQGLAPDRRGDVALDAHRHETPCLAAAHAVRARQARAAADGTDHGRNSGPSDEKTVLRQHLQPDRCYVMDRWYAQFTLFNEIHRVGSSYVCRLRDNTVPEVVESRPLSAAALAAGVLSDEVVRLGLRKKPEAQPGHPLRLIMVRITPHAKRSNRKGHTGAGPSDGLLRIATNLLDVPAEIIALMYQYRYTIELFFRFFKHVLGCRHLLSDDRRGIEIQTYCAIIACMLISLTTGRKPSLRTYEMICYYLTGLADEEELLAHLAKLKHHEA